MKQSEINKLAEEIAEKTKWDGYEICQIFLEALTEANFHTLRKQIEPIINAEFE